MEDISSKFEGCKVADVQEHLLTVAPLIPLGPDDFTKEELASYGMCVSTFIENLIKSLDAVDTVVKTTLSSQE